MRAKDFFVFIDRILGIHLISNMHLSTYPLPVTYVVVRSKAMALLLLLLLLLLNQCLLMLTLFVGMLCLAPV